MNETVINVIEQCCDQPALGLWDPANLLNFLFTLIASGLAFWTALFFDRRVKNRDAKKERKREQEEQRKEAERKVQELKDRLHYLVRLIESTEKTVTQQVRKCEEVVESIKKNPYDISHVTIIASNDIRRILALDAQSTFYAYRYFFKDRTDWIRDYSEFNSALDFIEGTLDEIKRIYFSLKETVFRNQLEYKKIVEDLKSYLYRILKGFEISSPSYETDRRYIFLGQMFLKFEELVAADPPSTFSDVDSQFLSPLKDRMEKGFEREPFAATIADLVSRAKIKLYDISLENESTAVEFQKIAEALTDSLLSLKAMRERIENNVL